MLTVRFSCENVDKYIGFILKVEMSSPGTVHPHLYAKQASYDDPAGRIAVKITAKLGNGEDYSLYAQQPDDGWKEPMRLNTVFDWFSGTTLEQTAAKNPPRRYIYISQKDYEKYFARQLSTFVRGGSPMTVFLNTACVVGDRADKKGKTQTRPIS
ncbi:hypothetical protein BDV32DRAFT_59645 [Aspergillus pseudonomiae]|nr:hypothetical protein BDV32DRAFT_59645 [Aspergillus pseudonomiae]